MRALKNIFLFFAAIMLYLNAWLPTALAAQTSILFTGFAALNAISVAPFGTNQSALKTSDSTIFRVLVHSPFGIPPAVTADLSELGVFGSTTVPIEPGSPNFNSDSLYDFGRFSISPDVTDGLKTVSTTVTDFSGDVSTSMAQIVIDNVPPTISLSSITFSTTSPKQGDYMFLSGKVDGTGSVARVYGLVEGIFDENGIPMPGSFRDMRVSYDTRPLNDALATSTDGTFTNFPVQLFEGFETGDIGEIMRSSSFRITISAYDEAGLTSQSSLTVPVPRPAPSEPCTALGTCVSNVLFLPGLEGSRLYMRDADGSERQLWEPSIHTDVPLLAMADATTSLNQVYTKDIIDSVFGNLGSVASGIAHLDPKDLEVYGDFETFMDGLVASSTVGLKEWRAYPYDWRYDVRDIVGDGTLTETADGSLEQVYLEDVLDQLASSSPTGKVVVVAHSGGGLLAKALLAKLAGEGKSDLVDQLIMIGTPEWGTPTDLGAMLHGDGGTHLLGLVSTGADERSAAATMPGPYALLPSSAYFAHVGDPVATFAQDDVAQPFNAVFPNGITSYQDLFSFVTNAFGLNASSGDADNLDTPLALQIDLLNKAKATHDVLDAWAPATSTKVTSIVGWGQLTTYSYEYASTPAHLLCEAIFGQNDILCSSKNKLAHTAIRTEDGDDTVVAPSASGDGRKVWYFDAESFQNDKKGNIVHQDLTSAQPIQSTLLSLLKEKDVLEDYMVNTKPPATLNPLTEIDTSSPVGIVATDAQGNTTGTLLVPDMQGMSLAVHNIPGSAVDVTGGTQTIFLPPGIAYTLEVNGYNSGIADMRVQSLDALGNVTQAMTLLDIPVTATSTSSFLLNSSNELSLLLSGVIDNETIIP
jgi:pimeloyl-ACP methyl ester carboxylesterase